LIFAQNANASEYVLKHCGAPIDPHLIPGANDLSTNFCDIREYFGADFKPPCTPSQEMMLKRNRNLFTSGEDNLVLRGVNLYGEKQWMLIADRFLPERSVNIISQRYGTLCYMLYKSQGIKIGINGELVEAKKLSSVDDLDANGMAEIEKLKKVPPPAILNVHRWSMEEDFALLKAVPVLGSMWAEIKERLLPHRDRGHIRKRYQVLDRRVKATVNRTKKQERIISTKLKKSAAKVARPLPPIRPARPRALPPSIHDGTPLPLPPKRNSGKYKNTNQNPSRPPPTAHNELMPQPHGAPGAPPMPHYPYPPPQHLQNAGNPTGGHSMPPPYGYSPHPQYGVHPNYLYQPPPPPPGYYHYMPVPYQQAQRGADDSSRAAFEQLAHDHSLGGWSPARSSHPPPQANHRLENETEAANTIAGMAVAASKPSANGDDDDADDHPAKRAKTRSQNDLDSPGPAKQSTLQSPAQSETNTLPMGLYSPAGVSLPGASMPPPPAAAAAASVDSRTANTKRGHSLPGKSNNDDSDKESPHTPQEKALFGEGATLMENDLDAISALNALSRSGGSPSRSTRSKAAEGKLQDESESNVQQQNKKSGGKSLFAKVVGGVKNATKRKRR